MLSVIISSLSVVEEPQMTISDEEIDRESFLIPSDVLPANIIPKVGQGRNS